MTQHFLSSTRAFALSMGLLSSLAFASDGVSLAHDPGVVYRKPAAGAAVFYVKNGFKISSEKTLAAAVKGLKGSTSYKKGGVYYWDLKGGILDGKNQRGDGGQREDQEPLARVAMALVIRNGFIRNNKNALTFSKPNAGVEKLTWLNVGEDALATARGAYYFTARDCEAINRSAGDKSFQFNEALGLVAENNLIVSGTTGMRIGDSTTTEVSERAFVANNRFVNVDTAYHLSKITVEERSKSQYSGVRLSWKYANGAKRIAAP